MMAGLAAGILAGYGVALPVGAIGTYLVALGIRDRFRVAAAAALGVATTDALFAGIAVLGGVGLRRVLRPAATPLTCAAAALLMLLALRTVVTARRQHRTTSTRPTDAGYPLRAYLSTLVLTAVNVSTLAYFTALIIGGLPVTSGSLLPFVVGVLLASASWQLVLVRSGAVLGRVLTGRRGQLGAAFVSAAVMLALAARLLLRSLVGESGVR